MQELTLAEMDQVTGAALQFAAGLATSYLVGKALDDIGAATWGSGGIGQISGNVTGA